nr:uncharacterized protein CI109_003357 [Kwoniella shandongensis]KAA5528456.1 hypothetical protein CI109_003357 [Kwoniella shandongensis]
MQNSYGGYNPAYGPNYGSNPPPPPSSYGGPPPPWPYGSQVPSMSPTQYSSTMYSSPSPQYDLVSPRQPGAHSPAKGHERRRHHRKADDRQQVPSASSDQQRQLTFPGYGEGRTAIPTPQNSVYKRPGSAQPVPSAVPMHSYSPGQYTVPPSHTGFTPGYQPAYVSSPSPYYLPSNPTMHTQMVGFPAPTPPYGSYQTVGQGSNPATYKTSAETTQRDIHTNPVQHESTIPAESSTRKYDTLVQRRIEKAPNAFIGIEANVIYSKDTKVTVADIKLKTSLYTNKWNKPNTDTVTWMTPQTAKCEQVMDSWVSDRRSSGYFQKEWEKKSGDKGEYLEWLDTALEQGVKDCMLKSGNKFATST